MVILLILLITNLFIMVYCGGTVFLRISAYLSVSREASILVLLYTSTRLVSQHLNILIFIVRLLNEQEQNSCYS